MDWGGAIGFGRRSQSDQTHARDRASEHRCLSAAVCPLGRIGILRTPLLGSLAIRSLNAFAGPTVSMAMSRQRLSPEAAAGLLAPYTTFADRVAVDGFVRDIPLSKRPSDLS